MHSLVNAATLLKYKTKVVGRKIAATSMMAQKSVSVHEPFYDSLFSHSTFATGYDIYS
jgi:2-keto-4-pentenoate hydratase